MDLLEYQAKELFRQIGIPVLPSQRIAQSIDVKDLKIPYPVILKSQVHWGKRGDLGGVRFAENTIDAIASAQALFRSSSKGKYPELLLVEPKYESAQEFYLSVVLDSATRRPLLLGSQHGGAAIEAKFEYMQQVIVDQEFSAFYARRLALKMGLKGSLIRSVSAVIEKMYHLFVQQDLDFVEVNPLAVSASGELMALDGKVTLNDAAIDRHENLAALIADGQVADGQVAGAKPQAQSKLTALAPASSRTSRRAASASTQVEGQVDGVGEIGVLCNGSGLLMATLDLITAEQGKLASFVDLGSEYYAAYREPLLAERLSQGLDLMLQDKSIKVILVNLLSGTLSCYSIAEVIVGKLKQLPASNQNPAIVVRAIGAELRQAQALLIPFGVPVLDQLDEAIAQSLSYAKSRATWGVQLEEVHP
jgi:succinyl-CoA synthetase beta subunit